MVGCEILHLHGSKESDSRKHLHLFRSVNIIIPHGLLLVPRRLNASKRTQAPKSLPPIAKQNLILKYLQESGTAHTIKELEKSLPSIASINGMQVKDYLQALSDENKIHVEKIGSGNWYWSFLSEERHAREVTLQSLKAEKAKIEATVQGLEDDMNAAHEIRGQDNEREALVERNIVLEAEITELKSELEGYKDGDPAEVDRKRKEAERLKSAAEKWTDNILILEGYLKKLTGGDAEAVEGIKRSVYGDEYVEGEGLRELES